MSGKRAADKFIPEIYLFSSAEQRLELLRGLMDTDGELHFQRTTGEPRTAFSSASEILRDQVAFLVESFGGSARKGFRATPQYTYRGEKRIGQPSYRLNINIPVSPFLTRQGWEPNKKYQPQRVIRSITPQGQQEVTCLRVAADDSLYLTEHCIVTHNTRVLELLEHLTPNPMMGTNTHAAVLWRKIDQSSRATILLDEVDTVFGRNGSATAHQSLRSILNAGYRQGATVPRCVGRDGFKEFNVFAPVAMAGLGVLPETIMSRAIVIRMKRRKGNQVVKPFRLRFARTQMACAKMALEEWAQDCNRQLGMIFPDMPVQDRKADIFEPLFAIASLAGGPWPERIRKACIELTKDENDQESAGDELMRDLHGIFTTSDLPSMFSVDLLTGLYDTGRWQEDTMDPRTLSRVLSEYGITPGTVRQGDRTARGYKAADFRVSWDRLGLTSQEEEEEDLIPRLPGRRRTGGLSQPGGSPSRVP